MKKVWLALAFTALGLMVLAGTYAIVRQDAEWFLPRFHTAQGPLNAPNLDVLLAQTSSREKQFLLAPVEWTSPRGNFTLSLADLGVRANAESIQEAIEDFMENPSPVRKLKLFFFGQKLDYSLTFDSKQRNTALLRLGIIQDLKNASYAVQNSTLVVVPEQQGFFVDEAAWEIWLKDVWSQPLPQNPTGTLALNTKMPSLVVADLNARLNEAQALASKVYILRDEFGRTWELSLAEHMDWLSLDEAKQFSLKEEALQSYVQTTLAKTIESQPVGAKIIENPDGSILFEGSARFGRSIQIPELHTAMKAHLEGTEQSLTVDIPVLRTNPEIQVSESLRARGVTDLLSVGHSNFAGSSKDRMHNVQHGINIFNASFIAKGAEFSFTDLMGPIDAAHGWRSELVILGDKTEKEYGGGLCQVSSTMFRSALFAGLPITARKNHSYWVTYYGAPFGPGLDATIYDPNPDLKFINDTAGDILVQGYIDGTDAYFVMYGSSDQRRVQMEGPFTYGYWSISEPAITQVDYLQPGERKLDQNAHTGFKADWYRTIFYADGTKSERENFHSNYEARPKKYFEGKPLEEVTLPSA